VAQNKDPDRVRKSRFSSRLGSRKGLCRGYVAHASTTRPQAFIIREPGETRSIREFIQEALGVLGLSPTWEGQGEDEVCRVGDEITVKI
jgi:GDP-D-mannose dehydratase